MQFGTINGNAAQAHDSALSWLAVKPGVTDFLAMLGASRLVRYRHVIVTPHSGWFNAEADDSHPQWWESGLREYAGRGIDIAAGLQHSTGSNQNEPV
jgi:hypothetical protein